MYIFVLNALALVTLAAAAPMRDPPEAPEISEFMGALRASTVAEIYIVSPGTESPIRLSPEMVRSMGCKYLLHRESPPWLELERALTGAAVRFAPADVEGEVRIGLVLSDERGIIREVYSNDQPWPDGRIIGLIARRPVEIPSRFVSAVLGFVARHRDLALPDSEQSPRCPPAARH